MVAQRQLVAFVKRQRERGLHDGAIAHALAARGWSSQHIHDSLHDESATIDSFEIDEGLTSFLESHLDSYGDVTFLDSLVKQGWSVSAINFAFSHLKSKASEVKEHFLHRNVEHKPFFSTSSTKSASSNSVLLSAKTTTETRGSLSKTHAADSQTTEKDGGKGDAHLSPAMLELTEQEKEMQAKIARLSEEFKRKEAQLKLQEEHMRDTALSSKLDDLKRMMSFSHPNHPGHEGNDSSVFIQTGQQPGQNQQPTAQQEQPAAPASLKTPNSSSPQPVYVVNQSKKKDQDMNSRFDALLSQNNNYLAYTNPVVPEKLHFVMNAEDDRIQTGISGLDPIIEGGLLNGSATLVGGGPGTGKSTFCLQYLVNGILNYDEPGIYISFEESKQSIYNLGAQFNWPLQQLEDEKKLLVKEYTPEQIDKVLESGGGSVRDLIDSIGAKRVVIDSITAFMLLYDGETAQRRACLQLFKSLSKWGCTTLSIAEEQGDVGKHQASVLEYETAAVILLYNERKGDLRQRSLEIFKMRGTRHAGRIFPMRITERGVEVYPRETF